jgi:hypothetical protein
MRLGWAKSISIFLRRCRDRSKAGVLARARAKSRASSSRSRGTLRCARGVYHAGCARRRGAVVPIAGSMLRTSIIGFTFGEERTNKCPTDVHSRPAPAQCLIAGDGRLDFGDPVKRTPRFRLSCASCPASELTYPIFLGPFITRNYRNRRSSSREELSSIKFSGQSRAAASRRRREFVF